MAMSIKTKKGLLRHYQARSAKVKDYFRHLPNLVNPCRSDTCMPSRF